MSSTDTPDTTAPAPSADEQPKKAIAKKVVSHKRRYFVPHLGSIEGVFASPEEAVERLEKKLTKDKKANNG